MLCTKCGKESDDTLCQVCLKKRVAQQKATQHRKDQEQAMRDLGLVKVRGALGGTYWE